MNANRKEIHVKRETSIKGFLGNVAGLLAFTILLMMSLVIGHIDTSLEGKDELITRIIMGIMAILGLSYFGWQTYKILKAPPHDLILRLDTESFTAINAIPIIGKINIPTRTITSFTIQIKGNVNGIITQKWLVANLTDGNWEDIVNYWDATEKIDEDGQEQIRRFLLGNGFSVFTK